MLNALYDRYRRFSWIIGTKAPCRIGIRPAV